MDRRIVSGAVAAVAAIGLGVGGALTSAFSSPAATDAALTDFADVGGNSTGAGSLALDLTPEGTGSVPIMWHDLMPGGTARTAVWVARNDPTSTVPGTLSVKFTDLVDTPAPCNTSADKARAEVAAGVKGCEIDGTRVSGVPERGMLSRMIAVDVATVPASADGCGSLSGVDPARLPATGRGNLPKLVSAGPIQVAGLLGLPFGLAPGNGVCLVVTARWPESSDGAGPADNVAQGDSLRVKLQVTLTQVHS